MKNLTPNHTNLTPTPALPKGGSLECFGQWRIGHIWFIRPIKNGYIPSSLPSGGLGWVSNRIAKGGLSGCKRPPFRGQKAVFCKAIGNILIIKTL